MRSDGKMFPDRLQQERAGAAVYALNTIFQGLWAACSSG